LRTMDALLLPSASSRALSLAPLYSNVVWPHWLVSLYLALRVSRFCCAHLPRALFSPQCVPAALLVLTLSLPAPLPRWTVYMLYASNMQLPANSPVSAAPDPTLMPPDIAASQYAPASPHCNLNLANYLHPSLWLPAGPNSHCPLDQRRTPRATPERIADSSKQHPRLTSPAPCLNVSPLDDSMNARDEKYKATDSPRLHIFSHTHPSQSHHCSADPASQAARPNPKCLPSQWMRPGPDQQSPEAWMQARR
jgi:hypothetical protein